MAEYKTLVNSVFTDRAVHVNDLLSTLFLDIYDSIKDSVDVHDVYLIDELKGFADELDLSKTAKRFYHNHFGIKFLPRNESKFSISSIHGFVESPKMTRKGDQKKKILAVVEKKYKCRQFDQYANIASQIVKWRNVWAHDGGFQNTSQALVLQSNLALLLKIYPDELQEKISSFQTYQQFINETFLRSILDLQEINEENIDEEIAKHIQQADVEDLSSNLEQFSDNIDEKLISFEQESKEVMKKVEQSIAGVEKVENRIDELNVSTNSILSALDSLKDMIHSANIPVLESSILETSILHDDTQLDAEPLLYQKVVVPEKPDTEDIEEAPINKLTKAEMKDNLIELRQSIKTNMKAKYADFQNWHNILMRPITDDLINNDYTTQEEFKSSSIFSYYYNSEQMTGKILEQPGAAKQQEDAKKFMDEQLKEFWPKISQLLASKAY